MDFEDGIRSINHILDRMPDVMEEQAKTVLEKSGTEIKKQVLRVMAESDIEQRAKDIAPSNHDGSKPYVHMKDEVRKTVKKTESGIPYVSVKGGKMTGYKWHMVSDGHIARDKRTFVPGNNFMGKALSAAEKQIDQLIDSMIEEVISG